MQSEMECLYVYKYIFTYSLYIYTHNVRRCVFTYFLQEHISTTQGHLSQAVFEMAIGLVHLFEAFQRQASWHVNKQL